MRRPVNGSQKVFTTGSLGGGFAYGVSGFRQTVAIGTRGGLRSTAGLHRVRERYPRINKPRRPVRTGASLPTLPGSRSDSRGIGDAT